MRQLSVKLLLSVYLLIVVFLSPSVGGKDCTVKVKKENVIRKHIEKPCRVSVQKRCGWFSLSDCTFYKSSYCSEASNETVVTYVTECCKGYIKMHNGSCVDETQFDPEIRKKLKEAAKEISTETPVYNVFGNDGKHRGSSNEVKGAQDTKQEKVETKDDGIINLSHGAYAGIACAVLFLGVIIALTVIRVRKRRKQRPQKKSPQDIEHAAQRIALHDPNTQQEATVQETTGETVT